MLLLRKTIPKQLIISQTTSSIRRNRTKKNTFLTVSKKKTNKRTTLLQRSMSLNKKIDNYNENITRSRFTTNNINKVELNEKINCLSRFIDKEDPSNASKMKKDTLLCFSDDFDKYNIDDFNPFNINTLIFDFKLPNQLEALRLKIFKNNKVLVIKSGLKMFHTTGYDVNTSSWLHNNIKPFTADYNEFLKNNKSKPNYKDLLKTKLKDYDEKMNTIKDNFNYPNDSLGFGQYALTEKHFESYSAKQKWRYSINIKYKLNNDINLLYLGYRNNSLDEFMNVSNLCISSYTKAYNKYNNVSKIINIQKEIFSSYNTVDILEKLDKFRIFITEKMESIDDNDIVIYLVNLQIKLFSNLDISVKLGNTHPQLFYDKCFLLANLDSEITRVSTDYNRYNELMEKIKDKSSNTIDIKRQLNKLSVLRGVQIMLVCKILGIKGWTACDICEIAIDVSELISKPDLNTIMKGQMNKIKKTDNNPDLKI